MARELAFAAGANFTGGAAVATSSTVESVILEADTEARAIGESGLARDLAFTAGADLTRGTDVRARATVGIVSFEVDTLAVALGQATLTA